MESPCYTHDPIETPARDPLDSFDRGDYLAAAREVSPDRWQHWASLAALGRTSGVADALVRFDDPAVPFHAGVAAWLDGDDERAVALLRSAQGEHAARLLALIERRPLTVLTQLPWNRSGSWNVLEELRDPSFRLLNVSFHHDDVRNRPYADVHELVPPGITPDFYLTEMLEWHLIPPNIRELGCPMIGHTSDYDIHIQAVTPWLEVFDELLVLDSHQWRDVSGLAPRANVSVFPKVFGVPRDVPPAAEGPRPIDVFLSGTVVHPFHPDKDALVLQLLGLTDVALRMVNGFDAPDHYYRGLANSKICANHVRHPGAMPTRALEALAMGCVATVQEENVLHLFLDATGGVVPYGRTSGSLGAVIQHVLNEWDTYARAAQRGATLVRQEFDLARVASQYLRFATVVAARPRAPRRGPDPASLVQKRAVLQKGWLPSYQFRGASMLKAWAESSVQRLQSTGAESSSRGLNDIARERLLAWYHEPSVSKWLPGVVAPLDAAVERFPRALVPRLNLIRILLHFGCAAEVRRGVALLDDTLAQLPASWEIDPLDDVLPWDFCPAFFNYRRYFDVVTTALAQMTLAHTDMTAIILASLHYYRGRYVSQIPGTLEEIDYAARATALDAGFAEYVLYYSRLLLERGRDADHRDAAELLRAVVGRSARVLEIVDLARQLPEQLRGAWYESLCARAERFWTATEMRENLPEPWLQLAREALGTP